MDFTDYTDLQVSEIFYSIQGEGRLSGVPSVFVRLAGCDLRCRWCDTPYALEASQGRPMTIPHIITEVSRYESSYVVVTGGEPLIAAELPELLETLAGEGKHLTVETSATRFREIRCDLISISPKLSNAAPEGSKEAHYHEAYQLNVTALRKYIGRHDYQLKFVVETEADLTEIEQVLIQLERMDSNLKIEKEKVMLMPQARTKQQHRQLGPLVARMCIEKGWRYGPRLQIELWGNRRGR